MRLGYEGLHRFCVDWFLCQQDLGSTRDARGKAGEIAGGSRAIGIRDIETVDVTISREDVQVSSTDVRTGGFEFEDIVYFGLFLGKEVAVAAIDRLYRGGKDQDGGGIDAYGKPVMRYQGGRRQFYSGRLRVDDSASEKQDDGGEDQ